MQSSNDHPERGYFNCRRCGLWKSRRNIVLRGTGKCSRGTVERFGRLLYYQGEIESGEEPTILPSLSEAPLILFIGEAPGSVEDLTGLPFRGSAGRIFSLCLSKTHSTFRFHTTNILACRPTTLSKQGSIINRAPSPEEIEQCLPRVKSIIASTPYAGIVLLGKVPQGTLSPPGSLSLKHPSAILRKEFKSHDIREFAFKLDRYIENEC